MSYKIILKEEGKVQLTTQSIGTGYPGRAWEETIYMVTDFENDKYEYMTRIKEKAVKEFNNLIMEK